MTTTLYRDYWATAGENVSLTYVAPRAGFQTVWVQSHLQHEEARTEALRAQWIEANATF